MISRPEAHAKFWEYQETLGSHDEVFTDDSKMNERVGAAAVIKTHFQNSETTCHHLTKRLPDNSTIFVAEATAITLAVPTATLFPRPIEPHRQRLQLRGQTLCWCDSQKGWCQITTEAPNQGKKSFKERVEITPSDIPNQAPTPRTKVPLDRSGPVGTRQGVLSPATKPAGDRPQRFSSTKWWRPLSFSGTLVGSGQTEEILTS